MAFSVHGFVYVLYFSYILLKEGTSHALAPLFVASFKSIRLLNTK